VLASQEGLCSKELVIVSLNKFYSLLIRTEYIYGYHCYSKNILIVAIDTFYFPLACMQAIYSFFRNQSLQEEKLCIETLSVDVKTNSFNFLKLKKKN
jgi:hypothetical protein